MTFWNNPFSVLLCMSKKCKHIPYCSSLFALIVPRPHNTTYTHRPTHILKWWTWWLYVILDWHVIISKWNLPSFHQVPLTFFSCWYFVINWLCIIQTALVNRGIPQLLITGQTSSPKSMYFCEVIGGIKENTGSCPPSPHSENTIFAN